VDDLVDVSRVTQGKIALERQAVDVAAAIEYAIESARTLLEAKRHQVTVTGAGGLLVDADRQRLAQVLGNLVSNAAKYTPAEGHIEIAATADGTNIKIAVCDDGIGISAGAAAHLFDMFVQGERNADRQEGGLGVGLTLVRKLVELHGGTVHAESAGLGTGATFASVAARNVDDGHRQDASAASPGSEAPPRAHRRR
jgi:signal transduction histidine kinase